MTLTFVLGLSSAAVVAYSLTDIPAPHPEAVVQSTVFVDVHGDYLGRRGPMDRQDVPLSQVPRHVQEAVIAAENRSFRTDSGIAPTAIARAVLAAVTGGARQGGSTITQQYIKNALLTPEQSMSRKAKEALIAVKLDRTRSKETILEGYLNTVYFGRGAAGIQAAARNYFGVNAHDLTIEQDAALAAVINLPSYYEKAGSDPKVTSTLQRRWAWVLDAMADSAVITRQQRAQAAFPAFRFYPPGHTEGQRQYLIDAAAAEATKQLGITQEQLARGGYTIHTTFDLTLQDAAAETVRTRTKPAIGSSHATTAQLHTAITAVVPGDGAIRLLYGGADYARQPFNDALHGAIEAGTTLEPFTGKRLGQPLDRIRDDTAPTTVQVSAAYAALAANGRYATPYTIAKITRNGRTLYTARPETHLAMTPSTAHDITRTLHSTTAGSPTTSHTGAAGHRTAWSTRSDSRLTLTAALFAECPATATKPAAPAPLADLVGPQPPTTFAAETTADLWASALRTTVQSPTG
ncbi:transglycosylase domain-containing protein [Streptomyces sp. SKN60]|uniref:transglycosylase domain-containing protein n=1 Tax=Streptomyces sp. SKN60 TaxID=2855506 RepID=UPI0022484943|nr:transglycosylase domain-containing protein [Streptomyces sp. SKN60]